MSDPMTREILRRIAALEAAARTPGAEKGGLVSLGGTSLAAGAASVVLTPVGEYTELVIPWVARGEAAASLVALYLRLNGDTSASYDFGYNQTANSANTPGTSTAQTFIRVGVLAAASAAAGLCGVGLIRIPFYRGTSFEKHAIYQSHARHSAAAADVVYEDGGGNWRSTAAVTSVTLLASTGNLAANSQFKLYGVL